MKKIVLIITLLLISISCKTDKKFNYEGVYYYPESCILQNDNSLKSKKGYNCLTIEFVKNNNKLIFTELDSSKDPWIIEYYPVETGSEILIKVKEKGKLFTFFKVDKDGNLRSAIKSFGNTKIPWKKL